MMPMVSMFMISMPMSSMLMNSKRINLVDAVVTSSGRRDMGSRGSTGYIPGHIPGYILYTTREPAEDVRCDGCVGDLAVRRMLSLASPCLHVSCVHFCLSFACSVFLPLGFPSLAFISLHH